MITPRTEAGKALAISMPCGSQYAFDGLVDGIAAIEDQAAAAERARIVEAMAYPPKHYIKGRPQDYWYCGGCGYGQGDDDFDTAEQHIIRAAIEGESK